ncbi:hypothetical protein TWF506_003971 [Arthrobotrys conoides]|uniref:Uncharacterized protein n=1 Tax=Arthrobotrys conoides TaxID=74498 RepID=A0AAN8RIT0_9PEZI
MAIPPEIASILYFLVGILILTGMRAIAAPLSLEISTKPTLGTSKNGTTCVLPTLNITNLTSLTPQSTLSEKLLIDPSRLKNAGLGEVTTGDQTFTVNPQPSSTMHIAARSPPTDPAQIPNEWLDANQFYIGGGMTVICPSVREITPEIKKRIERYMGGETQQIPGISQRSTTRFMNRLTSELQETQENRYHRLIDSYLTVCRGCTCTAEGEMRPNEKGRAQNTISSTVKKGLRSSLKCGNFYPKICPGLYRCYCFATLGQPGRVLRGTMEDYIRAFNQIPRYVRSHPTNSEWRWVVPPGLAEFPGQSIQIGGDHELPWNLEGGGESAGNSGVNVSPPNEAPYYLSGPEDENPDDPGEGSSTGATRPRDPFSPNNPDWDGWGYGYGYGFREFEDGAGGGGSIPPKKRGLSIQEKTVHSEASEMLLGNTTLTV